VRDPPGLVEEKQIANQQARAVPAIAGIAVITSARSRVYAREPWNRARRDRTFRQRNDGVQRLGVQCFHTFHSSINVASSSTNGSWVNATKLVRSASLATACGVLTWASSSSCTVWVVASRLEARRDHGAMG